MEKNIPKRRFKEFIGSGEWEEKKLGEISDVRDGTHDSPKFVSKGYPLITSKNVRDGYINYSDIKYISKKDYENINKRSKVDKNDILMGMIGTIGNIALIRKTPKFAIKNVALVKDINKVNYLYLYYNMQCPTIELQLFNRMDGGTQKFISLNKIRNLNVQISPIPEQEKIGNFFQKLDRLIEINREKLGKLKASKSAYLEEMFPREGEDRPRRRFKGFTGAWEEKKLGEVVDELYNGQTPSRFNSENWNGDINWLSSGELNRKIVTKTKEKITKKGKKDKNLKIVPKGTVVIAITGLEAIGTRGNCAKLGIDTTLNQSCMAIYPKKNILNSEFLFYWYIKFGNIYGLEYTQGTKQQSYNANIINILPISIPSLPEQEKIGDFFKKLDQQIGLQEEKLEKLEKMKKAYLAEMFV